MKPANGEMAKPSSRLSTRSLLTAKPPREVSLYLSFMSRPVSRMVLITLSSETWCLPSLFKAMRLALIALTEPIALRSMQGICTRPPIGVAGEAEVVLHADLGGAFHLQHVASRAAAVSPPAAIEQATPTSPWQPTSAPEIEAFSLYRMPIAAAVSRKLDHAVVVGFRAKALVVMQHGRHDTG